MVGDGTNAVVVLARDRARVVVATRVIVVARVLVGRRVAEVTVVVDGARRRDALRDALPDATLWAATTSGAGARR